MTVDYEQAYRDLAADVEALAERLAAGERAAGIAFDSSRRSDDFAAEQRQVFGFVAGEVRALLASSAPATASEGATEGGWLRDEYERAKKRNEQIPPHARMVVTNPNFGVPTKRTHAATGVTSSDGDRELSEEDREAIERAVCMCDRLAGERVDREDRAEARAQAAEAQAALLQGQVKNLHGVCDRAQAEVARLRAAQPEGVEHVEWRVESESLEDEFGADEEGARRWVATCRTRPDWESVTLMRRTVRTVVGPWEPVEEGEHELG